MVDSLLYYLHYCLHGYWQKHGDSRSQDFLLIRCGIYGQLVVLGFYLVAVTIIGPRLMHHRPPFDLRRLLIGYNLAMMLLNLFFFAQSLLSYNYGLDMFDFDFPRYDDYSEIAYRKIAMCQLYVISKYLDLLDTVFFVLRKKQNQVTKLHLYHHVSVPALGWLVLRVVPTNGPLVIFPLCNTLIHVVMYSYYALAALGPAIRPYLWWKRYVTQLQIYQFVVYAIFSWIFAANQRGYPLYLQVLACTQPIIFLILFSRFYFDVYVWPEKCRRIKTY